MNTFICATCGNRFNLTDKDVDYYKDNGLSLPTHCPSCRKLRKLMPESVLLKGKAPAAVEVVCPICGVIYPRLVEWEHRTSEQAWRRAGYLVIICDDCKERKESVAVIALKKAKEPRKIGGWTFA